MKKIVLSLALSVVFACCACLPAAAADATTAQGWQYAVGPYQGPGGNDETVSGRLILSGGQTVSAGDAVQQLELIVGDMEPAIYRNGTQLADDEPVATGDTVRSASSSEPLGIIVRGDVTRTGSAGLRQVIQISKAVRGNVDLTGCEAEAADANGSGKLDLGDVVLAAKYMTAAKDDGEEAANPAARAAQKTGAKSAAEAKSTAKAASKSGKDIMSQFTDTVLSGTNKLRADNGIKPELKISEKLTQAAQVRADEMAASGVLSHTRPDGSKYSTVCTLSKGLVVGENIHSNKGYPLDETAQVAMEGWENSKPHRKQILEPRYSHIGIAFSQAKDGTWYCVQLFSNGDGVQKVDTPKAK